MSIVQITFIETLKNITHFAENSSATRAPVIEFVIFFTWRKLADDAEMLTGCRIKEKDKEAKSFCLKEEEGQMERRMDVVESKRDKKEETICYPELWLTVQNKVHAGILFECSITPVESNHPNDKTQSWMEHEVRFLVYIVHFTLRYLLQWNHYYACPSRRQACISRTFPFDLYVYNSTDKTNYTNSNYS